MGRKILGLDIRDKSLAAVLITGTLQGNQIEVFEYIDFSETESDPSYYIEPEDEETETDNSRSTFEEILKRMLSKVEEKIDISGCTCVVSLPASFISFRNIQVPFKNEKKIKQMILFELEPVMPGSVDDLVVDFKIIDSSFENEETTLVTASVEREQLETFESCLKERGFDAQAVLPGGNAVAEYLTKTCNLVDYLFADVDGETCTLFVIRSKQIVFIRSFVINKGDLDTLGLNIKRTILSFCEQYDSDYDPNTVFVSGAMFQIRETLNELANHSGLKIALTDFYESTGFLLENRLKNSWDSALYDNALALTHNAMFGVSGLKFSESFFAVGKYFSEYKKQIINAGILLLLVIIAGLGNIGFAAYTVNKKIKTARAEMVTVYKETFPNAKVINDPYAQMKGKINEVRKNSAFQDKSSGNIRVIDMLNDMSKKLPGDLDIEFSRFVLGTENLKISGDSDTYASVDKMKKELERINYFKKVVISSTTNNKSGEGVLFKLLIEF